MKRRYTIRTHSELVYPGSYRTVHVLVDRRYKNSPHGVDVARFGVASLARKVARMLNEEVRR